MRYASCPEHGTRMKKIDGETYFCQKCADEANDDADDELNEHPYIYCCGIQHESDEIACRSCGDYF